jgi:hypothetical protein
MLKTLKASKYVSFRMLQECQYRPIEDVIVFVTFAVEEITEYAAKKLVIDILTKFERAYVLEIHLELFGDTRTEFLDRC